LSGAAAPGAVQKRSVVVSGHRTSISLEAAFWEALAEIARAEDRSLNQLVSAIDAGRGGNLSSAVRVYVLRWFRARAGARPAPRDGA
jgi:predicted DNA-binding ribbon-helix-helix protein